MKLKQTLLSLCGFAMLCALTTTLDAQVTIGSTEKPVDGALLQLKSETGITNGDANAKKGLGLPRVALVFTEDLAPAATSPADNAAHTGLTVYNTTDNTATVGTLKEGVYTWDGTTWQRTQKDGYEGFGPWFEVGTSKASVLNTTDSYLNAKAVIGGSTILNDSKLSVHGTSSLQGNVGVNTAPKENASLTLGGTGKGFMPNKVALTSVNDNVTIPVSVEDKGMIVYHIGGDNLKEGIYTWNGGVWKQLVSEIPISTNLANKLSLGVNTTLEKSPTNIAGGKHLTLGTQESDGLKYITIPEDGSYAFSFRLYGSITSSAASSNSKFESYYINLWLKEGSISATPKHLDSAELGIKYGGRGVANAEIISYSVTLACQAKAGDKVFFKMCLYGTSTLTGEEWILRPATSVIWWKL